MKILLCHNYYQQPGGEDQVFADEAKLLESHGHEVVRYSVHNDAINTMNRVAVAARAIWNRDSYRKITELLQQEQPDVVHFTNTFPQISPAAYYAVKKQGLPVVQSLHNYRLLCPGGTFYRDGKPCEDCLGKIVPLPAVMHGCYRSSRIATCAVAAMTTIHRAARTWHKMVDRYIALSHFAAAKYIAGGLPAEKIYVKPNFISPDPGVGQGRGDYALFVGRLVPEKGIETMLDAWDRKDICLPLKIIGDGPLAASVRESARRNPHVEWLGRRNGGEVLQVLRDAACLVMPSEWYECCPKTLIEALAVGTPAVVSRLGAMAEMIQHEVTGLHFEPCNADDLAAKTTRLAEDSQIRCRMRLAARQRYERFYTADENYQMLLEIYQQARTACGAGRLVNHSQARRPVTTSAVVGNATRVSS